MTGRARRRGALALALLSLGTLSLWAGCVLYDTEIDIEDEDIANRNAVRFAEPVLLPAEAQDGCPENVCPQPFNNPANALPYFLEPSRYRFCSCAPNETSEQELKSFTLYVEDRDENPRTSEPRDRLYAGFFIDLRPDDPYPPSKQAFDGRVISPETPLDLVDFEFTPFKRQNPHLRQLTVGGFDDFLDLCNQARDEPLSVGYHTLKIMVTDRPWFEIESIPQVGIPDLARGATFDSVTYVFYCLDGKADDNRELCKCSVPETY